MEENNDNNMDQNQQTSKVVKDIANTAIKKIKSMVMSIVSTLVGSVATLAIKIALVVVVVLVISGLIKWVQEKIESITSPKIIYDSLEIEDTSELVNIKKDTNGDGYHLEFVDHYEKNLEDAAIELSQGYGSFYDTEILKKFMQAEMSTRFPNLGGDGEGFQGIINVKRITPNKEIGEIKSNIENKQIDLKYVDKSTFDNYVSSNDSKALEVFTLSDDNKDIITATWSYDGNTYITTNSGMDYRSVTSQYTMPFEYLLFFQIAGNDEQFSTALADLALNSSIDIVIIDNISTIETSVVTTTYEYDASETEISNSIDSSVTTVQEDVSTSINLSEIDAWWIKRSCSFENTSDTIVSNPIEETISQEISKDGSSRIKKRVTTNTILNNNVTCTQNHKESKEQDFANIFKNSIARGNIQNSWLIDFISSNEKTANMVELTKYLLYKAADINYGVTKFENIDLLSDVGQDGDLTYSTTSGIAGDEGKIFDFFLSKGLKPNAVAAIMGNIKEESGCRSNNAQDSFGYDDVQYTNNVDNGTYSKDTFINDKIGYGLVQWTYWDRKKNLYEFAQTKQTSIGDLNMQLEFLWVELNTSHQKILQYLQEHGNDSIDELTEYFMDEFENPSAPKLGKRQTSANDYYNKYKNNQTTVNGSKIIQIGAEMMQYMINNGYLYSQSVRYVPIEKSEKESGKYVDCSAYVCWVLYRVGYTDINRLNTTTLPGYLSGKGFNKITSLSDMKEGDIAFFPGHTQIYAGNENGKRKYLNAGHDPKTVYETFEPSGFLFAYRVP